MNRHSSRARNTVERAELEPSFDTGKEAWLRLNPMQLASLGLNDGSVWNFVP